jgi:TPR repeat protein
MTEIESIMKLLAGVMYAGGYGVTKDDKTALDWFQLAADQEHTDAQHVVLLIWSSYRFKATVSTSQQAIRARKPL